MFTHMCVHRIHMHTHTYKHTHIHTYRCVASVSFMAKDMYDHKKLKARGKTGGATVEEV